MQIRASKHFFSTLRAHLNPSLSASQFLYVPLAHLSSNPRRPFRGRSDGSSEKDFPIPRGERRRANVDPDDFFPGMRKDRDLYGKNRPIEGGQRGRGRFGDFSQTDEEELQSSPQFQTSDRELQGETAQTKDNPTDFFSMDRPVRGGGDRFKNLDESERENEKSKALDRVGETLFEKLKLGERKEESQPTRLEVNASQPPEQPPQEADEIFRKMKETGLIPNAVSMLDGLCKDGLVQEAMKLFSLMREKGSIPEVVIYTAVVDGFCKAGKCDDAKRIFRKMQKNGVVPNAYSYGLIIQWLCTWGKLDDCVEFCVEMFEAGHMPNAQTFVKLVDAFCKGRGREEAERLVKSFQDRNFAIDEKSIREHLDRKGPFDSNVSEVIFGKKGSRSPF